MRRSPAWHDEELIAYHSRNPVRGRNVQSITKAVANHHGFFRGKIYQTYIVNKE